MRPGRIVDHSPSSSAEVLEEKSYTSTPLWAAIGTVTGLLYLLYYVPKSHLSIGLYDGYAVLPVREEI